MLYTLFAHDPGLSPYQVYPMLIYAQQQLAVHFKHLLLLGDLQATRMHFSFACVQSPMYADTSFDQNMIALRVSAVKTLLSLSLSLSLSSPPLYFCVIYNVDMYVHIIEYLTTPHLGWNSFFVCVHKICDHIHRIYVPRILPICAICKLRNAI